MQGPGAVASVRVLRTTGRRAAGAGTPRAEALSTRALSVTVQTSQQLTASASHCTRHCGATAIWRRAGVNHMSAQEARVDVFDKEESPKCLRVEGALGEGRRSWDADTRKAATGP
jgi:hypothetical protein